MYWEWCYCKYQLVHDESPILFVSLFREYSLRILQGAEEILIANFNPEKRKNEKSLRSRDLKPSQNKYVP